MAATEELLIEWARRRRYDFTRPADISQLAAEALADGNDTDSIIELASTMDPEAEVDSLIGHGLSTLGVSDPDAAVRVAEATRVCREISAGTIPPIDGVGLLTKLFFEDESDSDLEVFWRLNAETDDLDYRASLEAEIRQASAAYRA